MGKVGARRLPHLTQAGGRQIQGEAETGQHQHGGPRRHPRLRQQGRPLGGHGPEHGSPQGQKRQERSRDDADDKGAPVARGGDSGAAAVGGSDEQPDGDMEADFGGDDEEATPTDDPGANIIATGAKEHPAADGPTASGSPGTDPTTTKQDACAGETGDRPSGANDQVAHDLTASGAGEITGSGPGQAGGLSESPSRRASPRPIAPSHRAGDAMANKKVRPSNSPGNDGNAGVSPPPHARRRSWRAIKHCGILWFNCLTQKMRASLWKKCSFKGFVKKAPEKLTFIPQPRFSCCLLIICDNWIFIIFFNIKVIYVFIVWVIGFVWFYNIDSLISFIWV